MRVGIMGGTFDPIHMGHLIAANEVQRTLKLDQVMFIPAGQPYQKSHRYITPARDRMFMVERAIFGNPRFVASDIEMRYEGPTHAVETMRRLRALFPDNQFYWIVGDDQLANITSWFEYRAFLEQVTVVAVNRPGASRPNVTFPYQRVVMPEVRISSTDLRARFAAGDDCRYLVPDPVRDAVAARKLYLD
jgi:nicotinate-nucleotide adenylyltransferase